MATRQHWKATLTILLGLCSVAAAGARPDILIADFEGKDYGAWKVEGNAFGPGPARGTLPNQQRVSGFLGKGLVNTYYRGDGTTGTLTSPPLKVERKHINFLIGGGGYKGGTCMHLLVDGKVVRTATGRDNELLTWCTWDTAKLAGKTAVLQVVDRHTGGWGHINVDHVVQSDTAKSHPGGDSVAESERLAEARKALLPRLLSLGVEDIVFAVRKVDGDGHWYANFSYWSNNPKRTLYHDGGRLCRLNLKTGEVTTLIDDPTGGVRDPQMHYDGTKILFSYRKGGQPFYHLYEINADGTGLRQLTAGPYDDLEPTYLPDGDIIFCSSRCNRMVNCYYVRVAVVYRCDGDGNNIRQLSANIEQDNTPWVLPDGRIVYTRWEYVDRSQVAYHHLWT
ncbi:PD40 domain-containing protein, partial [bacterium]|nr:PD40 domain-containing protein [bacterium]